MAFVLLIHSETLGVKINNPTCFLKCIIRYECGRDITSIIFIE